MFVGAEQLFWIEEGKAFRDPGPDNPHLCPCDNAGAEAVKIHYLARRNVFHFILLSHFILTFSQLNISLVTSPEV